MDYYINDYAWEKIYMFLTTVKGIHCRNSESLRTFIEGVYYAFYERVVNGGCFPSVMVIGEQFINVLSIGQNGVFGRN
jgi:hypothetical protein